MNPIVLASTSRWRLQLLKAAGLDVEGVSPGVDEAALIEPRPVPRAEKLALAKARAVEAARSTAWVLGADQVVWDGVEVFGKPVDPADHLDRLRSMRGRRHELVTAFALLGPGGVVEQGVERTVMWVRADIEDAELAAYVASGEGAGCAGGYAAEGRGAFLFERVEGDWNNVIGLPLFSVLAALRRHGWRFGGAGWSA
jgi:septum formation protein